jgi:hypothetical protein
MRESRRGAEHFEDELEGKLSLISQRRSNKKMSVKPAPVCQQHDYI